MNESWIIVFRTVFLYITVLIVFRLMGKREVGELSVMDLVIFVIIAEVAAFALEDIDVSLFKSIIPIITLLIIQVVSSYFSLKSKAFRDLVDGDPVTIIRDGKIVESAMRQHRYNLDDLFQQLREQQIGSVQDVTYAFLESSGNLSVFTKDDTQPVLTLISDGEIQLRHLQLMGKSEEWLIEKLKEQHLSSYDEIFYCSFENGKLFVQMKGEA